MSLSAQEETTMSRLLSYLTPSSFRRRAPDPSDSEAEDGEEEEVPRSVPLAAELFPKNDGQGEPAGSVPKAGDEPAREPRRERVPSEDGTDHKHDDSVPSSNLVDRLLEMLQAELTKKSAPMTKEGRSKEETEEDQEYCRSRGRLPKIEYSKLVVLSLTNFGEYKEAIKVLGYARKWPKKFADPSLKDLELEQKQEDKSEEIVRREAYLVLYQLIPAGLKYLVVNIEEGDVISLWKALYQRFQRVTKSSLKQMKKNWESIVQGSLPVDEFVSYVSLQAKEMRMVGVDVSAQDEANALLFGLNDSFAYIKNHYTLVDSFTFQDVAKASINFAVDQKLFTKKEGVAKSTLKSPCINFNEGKCHNKKCNYQHTRVSAKEVAKLKEALALKKKKRERGGVQPKVMTVQKTIKCFKCQQVGHVIKNCPNKEKVDKLLKTIGQAAAVVDKEEDAIVLPCFLSAGINDSSWVLDSGASQHITNRVDWMQDVVPVPENTVSFTVGNKAPLVPTAVGKVKLGAVVLTSVYFCRECPLNLMSEGRLLECGADINKTAKDGLAVVVKGDRRIFMGVKKSNLFVIQQAWDGKNKVLNISTVYSGENVYTDPSLLGIAFNGAKLMDFHRKWGHLNFKECLKELDMDTGAVKEMRCPECELTKSRRKPAPKEAITRADQPVYRLHADLSGRKLQSLQGYRYYLIVVDDCSRYRWVRMLRNKSDAENEVCALIEAVEREKAPAKVSVFRSDGGGEFITASLKEFFKQRGIKPEKSAPYSQFQNGVAERSIGIIDECARAMMMVSSSPSYDWCHAVNHAVYVRNRLPTRALDGVAPVEVYSGIQRTLRDPMPIFGCLGYAKQYVRGKQEPKATRVVFLCSSDEYKADYVRDLSSFSSSLKEFFTRDVRYDTRIFPYKSRLVPRPVVPPMDEEDVKEMLRVEEAERKQRALDEVEVLDVDVDEKGVEAWEVERIIDRRISRFGPRDQNAEERGFDYKVVWKPEGSYPDSWEPAENLAEAEDAIKDFEDLHFRSVRREIFGKRAFETFRPFKTCFSLFRKRS